MKLSKDNVDAIKSSVLVGLAYAIYTGIVAFVFGLLTGLLTTWDTES